MESNLTSISKLFMERLFRIPDYQRGYAWEKSQLQDFWNDLTQLEDGRNHYLGVITLEDVPVSKLESWVEDHWIIKSKKYEPFFVVDGQQRLTTTIILIQSIIGSMDNEECTLNYTDKDEIRKKFIYEKRDGKSISRSYIFGYERDNPSNEYLKVNIFGESGDLYENISETIYTNNLTTAKEFFSSRVNNMKKEEKESLYTKVTQGLLFNIYKIGSDIDVYVAFETMNNRGKALSTLELLKNRLIYLSTKLDVPDFEKEKLRSAVNESWKSIYHQLGRNKKKPLDDDKFLKSHFIIYFGSKIKLDIDGRYRWVRIDSGGWYKDYLLEKYFTAKNIIPNDAAKQKKSLGHLSTSEVYDYVRNLKLSVELWYMILNPEDSNFPDGEKLSLERIARLDDELAAPLIMVFLSKVTETVIRDRFLSSLERLIFFVKAFGGGQRTVRVTLLEAAAQLFVGSTSAEKVMKLVEDTAESMKPKGEALTRFIREMKTSGFYTWPALRFFLYEYECHLMSGSKSAKRRLHWVEYSQEAIKDVTVEHVYPQNAKRECWVSTFSHYTPRERSVLKHTLGNLVPLARAKNSSLRNECFCAKKDGGDGWVGFRQGSYNELEIAGYEKWTAKEILFRGIKMLSFMEGRWDIEIGDDRQKARFLGLDFVEDREGSAIFSDAESDGAGHRRGRMKRGSGAAN